MRPADDQQEPASSRLQRRLDRERKARLEAEVTAERGTRELYEKQRELLLHKAIAVAANEAASIEDAMRTALEEVCAYTRWPVGHVYLLAEDSSRELVPTAFWHLDDPRRFTTFRQITEATRFPPGVGLPGRVLSSGKPAWIMDVNRDDNFPRAQQARDIGVKAGFAFPMLVAKEVVGVLEFFAAEALEPDTRLLDVMTQIGTELGRVVERRRAEDRIRHLAYHDPLTGLPNRALLEDRFSMALAQAHRSRQALAVMSLDLDRFKLINDTLGHLAGDHTLRVTAQRLAGLIREGDTAARFGGDEFILLLPGVAREEDAAKIADTLLTALRTPLHVDGREFYATASIGISLYPHDGADAEALVKNADAAMYRAKELGRNNFQLYTPAMNVRAFERLTLESELRRAIDRQEFVVYYQPQVQLKTQRIVGTEALLRWQHPARGLILPKEFIPLAEDTGLIVPLGEWVLRTSCRQVQAWREAGLPTTRLAVNISMRQFQHPGFINMVDRVLAESGLDPQQLELEVTESVAMRDADPTIELLRELQRKGIRLSIDDFGTGYSSLRYLKELPIHTLKIDQSFIHDLASGSDDAAIAVNIIDLGHRLNLNVVAEGVETEEQLAFLAQRQCDEAQGYLWARPMPAQDLEAILRGQTGLGQAAA